MKTIPVTEDGQQILSAMRAARGGLSENSYSIQFIEAWGIGTVARSLGMRMVGAHRVCGAILSVEIRCADINGEEPTAGIAVYAKGGKGGGYEILRRSLHGDVLMVTRMRPINWAPDDTETIPNGWLAGRVCNLTARRTGRWKRESANVDDAILDEENDIQRAGELEELY